MLPCGDAALLPAGLFAGRFLSESLSFFLGRFLLLLSIVYDKIYFLKRFKRGSGCCVSAISLADEESVCFCRGTDRENANLLDAEWKSGDWKLAPELRDPLEAVKPKSLHSVHPVKIVFVNTLQIPIVIYWIDYEGTANKYKTLLPGQLYRRAKTISTIMNIINKSVQK